MEGVEAVNLEVFKYLGSTVWSNGESTEEVKEWKEESDRSDLWQKKNSSTVERSGL